IEWAAAAVSGASRLIVVGPPRGVLPGAVVVREDPPGAGPVPALRAGLAEVRAPRLALLAADMPFLRPAHVALLLDAMGERPGAVSSGSPAAGAPRSCGPRWAPTRARRCAGSSAPWGPSRSRRRGSRAPPGTTATPRRTWPPPNACFDRAKVGRSTGTVRGGGPMSLLEDWINAVCAELGVERCEMDRDLVLDL